MYKVVLIDDESIITEGLRKVVDWTAHNCQVAALAQDAHIYIVEQDQMPTASPVAALFRYAE